MSDPGAVSSLKNESTKEPGTPPQGSRNPTANPLDKSGLGGCSGAVARAYTMLEAIMPWAGSHKI